MIAIASVRCMEVGRRLLTVFRATVLRGRVRFEMHHTSMR